MREDLAQDSIVYSHPFPALSQNRLVISLEWHWRGAGILAALQGFARPGDASPGNGILVEISLNRLDGCIFDLHWCREIREALRQVDRAAGARQLGRQVSPAGAFDAPVHLLQRYEVGPLVADERGLPIESTMISSFFDIYIEVSTDGGGSWEPADEPARMELKVDPALIPPVVAPRPPPRSTPSRRLTSGNR